MHLIQLDCYNNDMNISAFLNITKLDIEIQNTTSITFQLFARNIRTIFCNDTIRCKLFHAFCNRYIMSSLICLILLSTFTFTHASIIQLLISATSSLMSTIYLNALFLGGLTLHKVHLPIRLVISCLSLPISLVEISLLSFAFDVNICEPVISTVGIFSILFSRPRRSGICHIFMKIYIYIGPYHYKM